MSAKKLPGKQELATVFAAYLKVRLYVQRVNAQIKGVAKVTQPKIPSVFSECLALHLLRDRMLLRGAGLSSAERDGKLADIVVKKSRSIVKIEVKSTAANFQELTRKDASADYLLWLDFSDIVSGRTERLIVYCLEKPGRLGLKSGYMQLSDFERLLGTRNAPQSIPLMDYLRRGGKTQPPASERKEAAREHVSGKALNRKWGVAAKHALFHAEGTFYMPLKQFPGAYFDKHGYVVFATEKDYHNTPGLLIGQRVNVTHGICALAGYVRKT